MSSLELNISIYGKSALKYLWFMVEKVLPDLPDYHPNTVKVVELAKEKFFPMLDEMLKLDDPEDYEKFEEFNEICDKIADLIEEIGEECGNDN